jgi:Na+-translocating ferredoxin:NAD+ oxidoreductase RnfD subunit
MSTEVDKLAFPASAAPEAPPARPAPPAKTWMSLLSFDNRFLAPGLITCILLGGHLSFGILEQPQYTLTAIGTAILLEIVLGKLLVGRIPHLASAYITGISVGILIRSPAIWPFAMCAAISIMSKYVLRWEKRHLWNPSNFGVSAMLFLYPTAVASLGIQWGNFIWPMLVIWGLGSIILYRLKRLHISVTYVVAFVVCAAIRSAITGDTFWASVAPVTGPMYQLFVFFMITDPPTTVRSKTGQCVVAVLVAVVEMVLRLLGEWHAPYYALFIVGPIANAIEIIWLRRAAPRQEAQPQTA